MAERILAIQAQDGAGARLAIRARTSALTSADVDRALNDRSLVVSWLNRGTLHLVRSEDFHWLHALTVPRLAKQNETRLGQEGVSPTQAEAGSKAIAEGLTNGPMGRSELRDLLDSAGVPTAGQALVHILLFTTIKGSILRGPVVGGEQKFVLVDDWLGPRERVDHEVAQAELARRYLTGHTAADDRDLAKWAGITLGQARKGLEAISSELEHSDDGLLRLEKRRKPSELPPPKLLGPFDPVLHGWASRDFLIPSERERAVATVNGIFRPTILVDGQVVGIWRRPGGVVESEPFYELPDDVRKKVELESRRVADYLSVTIER